MFLKVPFILLLTFSILAGCQDEIDEIEKPPLEDLIGANSPISDLVRRVVLKDGSNDNIIDKSSCTTVLLPITVVFGREEFDINSEEDFKILESILAEIEEDDVDIVFPITVIFDDYSELIVANQNMLDGLREECEEGEDEDIECVDFKYPVSLSTYDSIEQTADVIVIDIDMELFEFIESIGKEDFVEFNFPITMLFSDGFEIEVNSNKELENLIESSINECDEDDDVEDDSDELFLEIEILLLAGEWRISLFSDTTVETNKFEEFEFSFNPEKEVIAIISREGILSGEWEVSSSDDGKSVFLELDFFVEEPPLILLDDDWEIIEYSENIVVMKAESETEDFKKMLTIEKI